MPIALPGVNVGPGLLGSGSYNGLSWGPGTKFHVSDIKGLDDLPTLRTSNADRAQDQGQFIGIDYLSGRDITITFALIGDTNADYVTLVQQARAAFGHTQTATELPLQIFGNNYLANARVVKRDIPYDSGNQMRVGHATVLFHCTDPRFYSTTLNSVSTSLPAATGGAAWPWVWPISWGSASGSGTFTATNGGSYGTRPTIRITGPVDNPTIENATLGKHLTFALTLATTDVLTIDLYNRTVILNGTASRRNTMTSDSDWWNLPPGDSIINYRANTVLTGSVMTLSWRSAFV